MPEPGRNPEPEPSRRPEAEHRGPEAEPTRRPARPTGPTVDLNADVGESYGAWTMGDDAALLEVVSSANLACGFHGGDPMVMAATARAAAARGVVVGAHVSYPDRVGFGRRAMDLSPEELAGDVLYQVGALDALARAAGTRVRYVKAHGALYHRVAVDPAQAAALVKAMVTYDPSLVLLTLPGSAALDLAREHGIRAVAEAFADRAYLPDASLVPRGQAGAVLTDPAAAVRQAVRLATEAKVVAVDGSVVAVTARSLCLHGDTPGAAALARAVRAGLDAAGVAVASFVGPAG